MDQAGAAAASPEVLLAAVVAAGAERRCYTCLVIMRFCIQPCTSQCIFQRLSHWLNDLPGLIRLLQVSAYATATR